MTTLTNKVAWVTGAGSGIGRATAIVLAKAGARVVLTGRRREALLETAQLIEAVGAPATVEPADLTQADQVGRVVTVIERTHSRLDILINNAGTNIRDRSWSRLSPEGVDKVVNGNLNSAFYCAISALPLLRKAAGLIINVASTAGKAPSLIGGPAYSAAKHGIIAMSHTINMEEGVNGVRSCAFIPGEVATDILNTRPTPVSADERARIAQPEDIADLILTITRLPNHLVMNEVMITPVWNRWYVTAAKRPS